MSIVNSCWNERLTNLNAPSIYQLFALRRCANCWSVARMMLWFPCFLMLSRNGLGYDLGEDRNPNRGDLLVLYIVVFCWRPWPDDQV